MVDISLIFPAFNENHVITHTLKEAVAYFESRNYSFEIIVSADGTDGTRDTVRAIQDSRISSIGSDKRQGKGHGIREAVKIANGKIIGFADADNKVPITELDKVLPFLFSKEATVVIGSRAMQNSTIKKKQPLYRQIGSVGFRYAMRIVSGIWDIPDTQCGFKFFDGVYAKELFSKLKIDGYMFDVELLYVSQKLKKKIAQVPIEWKDDGDSRLELFAGNFQNMLDLFKVRYLHS